MMMSIQYIMKSAYAGDWDMILDRLERVDKDWSTLDTLRFHYYDTSISDHIDKCLKILSDEKAWLYERQKEIKALVQNDMQLNVYKGLQG